MLNVGRAIRWDSALGVGRHKVSDYVIGRKKMEFTDLKIRG